MNKLMSFSNDELVNELIRRGGVQYMKEFGQGKYKCTFASGAMFSWRPGGAETAKVNTISGQVTKGKLTILVIKDEVLKDVV
jgi:hypothetical protein